MTTCWWTAASLVVPNMVRPMGALCPQAWPRGALGRRRKSRQGTCHALQFACVRRFFPRGPRQVSNPNRPALQGWAEFHCSSESGCFKASENTPASQGTMFLRRSVGEPMKEYMENQMSGEVEQGSGQGEGVAEHTKTTFVREVATIYRGARRATKRILEPSDAADFIRSVLPDNSREHFVALFLDGGHKIVAFSVISTGTANACPVHPREVFQNAIHVGAVALVVGHNHPSGDVVPSHEDERMTARLKQAGEILGIPLLDHLIIGDESIHSFSEHKGK